MSYGEVYVAGRTSDIQNVRWVQEEVRGRGGLITLDWTNVEGGIQKTWKGNEGGAQDVAENERDAVERCDLLILVLAPGGLGMYIETGMALAQHKNVIVYGKQDRDSVFWYLPVVQEAANARELCDCLDDYFDPA